MRIPEGLAVTCSKSPEHLHWLRDLPTRVEQLLKRWELKLGRPYEGKEVSEAWVAAVTRSDGTSAVLKLSLPHMEARHEIEGLQFWNGDSTVFLLECDRELGAMLLEYCDPGTHLRKLPEPTQDAVIAGLLRKLWKPVPKEHPFRHLSIMIEYWVTESREQSHLWPDRGLAEEGLRLFDELSKAAADDVLLVTDLHAGNVLRATREPWLVIDPKPFVGDRAYDATQHLRNCRERLSTKPFEFVRSFCDLLGIDEDRVRLWMFARLAAEASTNWKDEKLMVAARLLSP